MKENWSLELPDGCPPETAIEPNEDMKFYRLVSSIPPTEDDFLAMTQENPKRALALKGKPNELNTYGLSLFDNLKDLDRAKKQMSKRKPHNHVVEVRLKRGDGVIQKTASSGHWTWWKTDSFDITTCKEIKL